MTFEEYLKQILPNIDDVKVQGIAKLAADKGFDNLTSAQKYTLETGIADFIMKECPNCGEEISYEDMAIAIENGHCSYCEHKWQKMQAE